MLSATTVQSIVAAIYIIEGGTNASKPYGILSVPVKSHDHAEKLCTQTVVNNYRRWQVAGMTNCYFDFLGNRYCPTAHDPKGNINWRRNIKRILKHAQHQPDKCSLRESLK